MKPILAYTPFRDLNNRDFVLVRLHDLFLVPVWMGGTHSDVVKYDQNYFFKMVKVQWWVRMQKGQMQMNNVYTKIARMTSGNVIW